VTLEYADVRNAYLTGDDLGRDVYVRQPRQGIPGVPEGRLMRAKKGFYGLVDVARKFFLKPRTIPPDIGFPQGTHDSSLFYMVNKAGDVVALIQSG